MREKNFYFTLNIMPFFSFGAVFQAFLLCKNMLNNIFFSRFWIFLCFYRENRDKKEALLFSYNYIYK